MSACACTRSNGRGKIHEPACPLRGARSGPPGKRVTKRVQVPDEPFRELTADLGLAPDTSALETINVSRALTQLSSPEQIAAARVAARGDGIGPSTF